MNEQEITQEIEQLKLDLTATKQTVNSVDSELDMLLKEVQELRARRSEILEKEFSLNRTIKTKEQEIIRARILAEEQLRLQDIENQLNALGKRIEEICKDSTFWNKILDFQRNDLSFMIGAWETGLSGILNANEMGLGKTFESVAFDYTSTILFKEKYGRNPRSLWITKKSLMRSSMREIQKWNPNKVVAILEGTDKIKRKLMLDLAYHQGFLIITNYDSMTSQPELLTLDWDFVYYDEVHKLKGGASYNPTKVWLNAKELAKRTGFTVMLSGSPVQNHPREMWSYLHIFDEKTFPSFRQFENTFCKYLNIDVEALLNLIKNRVIRHRKDEVKIQMPPIVFDKRELDLYPRQRALYEQLKNEFFIWLDSQADKPLTATAVIAQITRMRQLNLMPDQLLEDISVGSVKIDEAMDIITECVEEGEQIVVFSAQFNPPLFEIKRRCSDKDTYGYTCEVISGDTKDVSTVEKDFQDGKIQVLGINSRMGAEGLNLQKSANWKGGASKVIFLDLWYNPKHNEQAWARVYRQGQTDPVTVYILHAVDTTDDFIESLIESKNEMIDGMMEDRDLRKGSNWKDFLKGKM